MNDGDDSAAAFQVLEHWQQRYGVIAEWRMEQMIAGSYRVWIIVPARSAIGYGNSYAHAAQNAVTAYKKDS